MFFVSAIVLEKSNLFLKERFSPLKLALVRGQVFDTILITYGVEKNGK
jgi:hypothetical protein